MVRAKGNLRYQFRNRIREIWSNLTDEEIVSYEIRRDAFFRIVEHKYGIAKEQAETVLSDLQRQVYEEAA